MCVRICFLRFWFYDLNCTTKIEGGKTYGGCDFTICGVNRDLIKMKLSIGWIGPNTLHYTVQLDAKFNY
jgi:hypothetical protein